VSTENAKVIRARVYDWFEKRYLGGPRWTSRSYHCFRDAPLELRIIVAMDKVEAEIDNGGFPQLLWNVFYHWRHLLDDCEAGYGMIGAVRQRDAIQRLRGLFNRFENDCRRHIEEAIQAPSSGCFNKWYNYGDDAMESADEDLFFHDDDGELQHQRNDWITKNEGLLLQRMEGEL